MSEKKAYSYEVDEAGKIHKIEPVKCPNCGSTKTEIGADYLYCHKCKNEVCF